MKKFFLLFALMLSPALAMASGGGACGDLHECEKAPVDLHNKASLQNGAKVFISYCLGCHSAKYLRYERMAQDLEIDPKLVEEYMMFTTDKIGDGIDTKVNHKDQAKWFGNAPPDLSLETRFRSPDWVYSYLLNFYPDDKRPWGVNNRVFKDVAMPHVLDSLEQELGPEGYKEAVGDLVNFMTYMAEPSRTQRESLGWWVLGFLFIFFWPVYFLNKEYWKDVK
ncbi:MAG: cytochrome c1 [Agitococcus sp.]|jgi:ubiquinol-cytochrome c reductase cytochrome c1 subunit|nr:cytochrome c1 [Moraxellaceae bacterium]MBP9215699.1 cytochrome c1 [Agitococcus sp.]MBK8327156.1 cytochrome c1 [Moraxellaceae bacterium]MBK9186475.1 cytochrome c1 [Moraxellaceae bacterium]MBL0229903.1 cytochrome c1 [Moraxellaceae bacterium]